jgi:predicted permease
MSTPLLRGRDFEEGDTNDSPLVAIVNQAFVKREFPNNEEDPVGKRVRCGLDRPEWMTIIGVVGDVRHNSPAEPAGAEIYMPARQHPFVADEMHVIVRTEADVAGIAGEVRKRAAALNPEVSTSVTTMNRMLEEAVATPKFRSVLLGVFALIAMLLAMAGVYGVMAFVVTQRTSELGLRVALGASTRDVFSLVLGRALAMAFAGLAIGACLSVALTRALQGMLYGVEATDVTTYGSAILLVGAVAVLAAAVPASRAARVNPVEALRAE